VLGLAWKLKDDGKLRLRPANILSRFCGAMVTADIFSTAASLACP